MTIEKTTGAATVLVADDDETVRGLIAKVLSAAGHTAAGGTEALKENS